MSHLPSVCPEQRGESNITGVPQNISQREAGEAEQAEAFQYTSEQATSSMEEYAFETDSNDGRPLAPPQAV